MNFETTDILIRQLSAYLELMMATEGDFCPECIRTAAEMALTTLDELSIEFKKLEDEFRYAPVEVEIEE